MSESADPVTTPGPRSSLERISVFWEFARPFTLAPPLLGFVSGAVTAYGAPPRPGWSTELWLYPLIGCVMAAMLNASSNGINQIYDFEIDRVNKPKRPLPSGRLNFSSAWWFTILTFVIALVLAFLIQPMGTPECFLIVLVASFLAYIYSAPPLRTKRSGIWANITIAIPRGVLLKVAGWSAVKTALDPEPWFIGLIFGLYILGASSTKDFSDIEGDRIGGCQTLPILYGVKSAARMIAPFFIIPFLLINLGTSIGLLTGNAWILHGLGVFLTLYGTYTVYLMLRRPEDLATDANHVSWKHMYLMMMVGQVGFALAYIL